MIFSERYGIWDQQKELLEAFKVSAIAYKEKAAALANTENSVKFSYAFLGILTFLYPLNLGFFQIYKKIMEHFQITTACVITRADTLEAAKEKTVAA